MPEKEKQVLSPELIKEKFMQFLQQEGIEMEAEDAEQAEARYEAEEKAMLKKARRPIKRLSESLNEINFYIPSYDLSLLRPGDIVYTMEKVPGNAGCPWEIRRPKLCIISAVRGSGADAVFYTYNYRVVNEQGYGKNKQTSMKIVSEEYTIAHPLTKLQAETMCAKFNFMAKKTYEDRLKKMNKPVKTKKNKKEIEKAVKGAIEKKNTKIARGIENANEK